MKKKNELKRWNYYALGGIAVFALIAVFSYTATAEFSFKAMVAKYAGETLGHDLSSKIDISGDEVFSAMVGPDFYFDARFHGTLQEGGGVYSTTSNVATSETLTEKDMLSSNYLYLMSNKAAFTWTLPATSTLTSMLQDVGDTREWIIQNATSSSGITLTIAAGSGIDLVAVTNANDVIDETEYAELKCTRIAVKDAALDVVCVVSELVAAD